MRSPMSLPWTLLLIWFGFLFVWFETPLIITGSERLSAYFASPSHPLAVACGLHKLRDLAGLALVVCAGLAVVMMAAHRRPAATIAFIAAIGHGFLFSAANISIDGAWALHEIRSTNRFEPQWGKLRRLQVIDAFSPTLYDYDPRARIPAACDSFDEFAKRAARGLDRRHTKLQCELRTTEEETSVIFAMHVASTWWSFGNRDACERPGSALENEENAWIAPSKVDAAAYLKSSIGCCCDMAYLMKILLDELEMPNRLVAIPGHVFNEVQIDGVWRLADPTINALADRTWDEIYGADPDDKVEVMVFPHPQLREQDRPGYRETRAQFRLMMLQRMATRPESLRRSYRVDLPEAFAIPKSEHSALAARIEH
jgi:hypothetical protein